MERNIGTFTFSFEKDTTREELYKQISEELYKRGILKIATKYDRKLEREVISCEMNIWWDENEGLNEDIKKSELESPKKKSIWRIFK